MSEQPTTPAGAGQLRTLAVRINEDLRAQLDVVAQLTGRSATEEIRLALEHWIEKTKSDPELLKKAERVRLRSLGRLRRGRRLLRRFLAETTPVPNRRQRAPTARCTRTLFAAADT